MSRATQAKVLVPSWLEDDSDHDMTCGRGWTDDSGHLHIGAGLFASLTSLFKSWISKSSLLRVGNELAPTRKSGLG